MKILTVPHKMLYRKADPVGRIDAEIQGIIDRMFITMYQARGIGLAANQVGVLKKVVVLNINYKPMVLINPVVVVTSENRDSFTESCLSIPGYSIAVERFTSIFVKSLNRHGKEQNFEASGLLARVIQHEVDHLQGRLINDV
jgi:peptide deformylase